MVHCIKNFSGITWSVTSGSVYLHQWLRYKFPHNLFCSNVIFVEIHVFLKKLKNNCIVQMILRSSCFHERVFLPILIFTMWPISLTDECRYPTKMHTMCLSTFLMHLKVLLLLLLCLRCFALPAIPLTDESTHRSRLHAGCTSAAKLDGHRAENKQGGREVHAQVNQVHLKRHSGEKPNWTDTGAEKQGSAGAGKPGAFLPNSHAQ